MTKDFKTETLKPCPFCGGEPEIVEITRKEGGEYCVEEDTQVFRVECANCINSGDIYAFTIFFYSSIFAIEAWNTRAPLPHYEELVGALRNCINELGSFKATESSNKEVVNLANLVLAKLEGGES